MHDDTPDPQADATRQAGAELDALRKALRQALAFMNCAKLDIEGETPKATTLRTLNGGIADVKAALAAPVGKRPGAGE